MSIGVRIEKMPTAYYVNKKEKISVPLSHINTADLLRGNKVINMGAELEVYDNVLPVVLLLCEEGCEGIVTHETIHIVLYEEEDEETTDLFDVIDIDNEISRCGLEKPDLNVWLNKYKFPIKTYDGLVKYLVDQINEHHKERIAVLLDYLFLKRELKGVD